MRRPARPLTEGWVIEQRARLARIALHLAAASALLGAGCSKQGRPDPAAAAAGNAQGGVAATAATSPARREFMSWPAPADDGGVAGTFEDYYFIVQRYVSASREPLGRDEDRALVERAVLDHLRVGRDEVGFQTPAWLSPDEVMAQVVWRQGVYWFVVRREAEGWAVHTKYQHGVLHDLGAFQRYPPG